MIVILGLIILLAAVITGVAGVLGNAGSAHTLSHGFAVFGYHVTGSTGTLFLYGIVVGAVALAGLSLLLAGARRTSRRGSAARRGLRQSRQQTAAVSQDRDDLIGQRDAARAYTASTLGNGTPSSDPNPSPAAGVPAGCSCSGAGPLPARPPRKPQNRRPASPPRKPQNRRPPAHRRCPSRCGCPRAGTVHERQPPIVVAKKIAHRAEAVKSTARAVSSRVRAAAHDRARARRLG